MGSGPLSYILAGDAGEGGVELDADDFLEMEFAGDEEAAAFACADVEEGVAVDGVGREGLAPMGDEGAQDGGRDRVVGGDVLIVGMAGEQVGGGDEAAGIDGVGLIEGVDGKGGELEQIARTRARRDEVGFGLGHVVCNGRYEKQVLTG